MLGSDHLYIAIASDAFCYVERLPDNPKTIRGIDYRQQRIERLQSQLYERGISEECRIWFCHTRQEVLRNIQHHQQVADFEQFIKQTQLNRGDQEENHE